MVEICPPHPVQAAVEVEAALLPLRTGQILVTWVAGAKSQIDARCLDEAGRDLSMGVEAGEAEVQGHLMRLEQDAKLALRLLGASGVSELVSLRVYLQ